MTYKLRELYETRFLYKPFNKDLNYLCNTIQDLRKEPDKKVFAGSDLMSKIFSTVKAGDPVELDLAGLKLSTDCASNIMNWTMKGIVFVDTEDNLRNEILIENRRRVATVIDNAEPLPIYDVSSSVLDYVKALRTDVVYSYPESVLKGESIYIPLMCIIMMSRPSVSVNVSSHEREFFNYVASHLTFDEIKQYDEFYITTQEGTQIVDFSSGVAHLQRMGSTTLQDAGIEGTIVPTVFGRENLVNKPGWSSLFKHCLSALNSYRATRPITLEEFFGKE